METKLRFTLALLLVLSVAFLGFGIPSALAKMTDQERKWHRGGDTLEEMGPSHSESQWGKEEAL
jgi:hypothetical protein